MNAGIVIVAKSTLGHSVRVRVSIGIRVRVGVRVRVRVRERVRVRVRAGVGFRVEAHPGTQAASSHAADDELRHTHRGDR